MVQRMLPPRFRQHGLALDVPISWFDLPSRGSENRHQFPYLRPTDLIAALVEKDILGKLVGGNCTSSGEIDEECLLAFWRRYACEFPDFGLYQASAEEGFPLRRVIPLFIHGDEGRGFKKNGILIVSFQPVIGEGTRPQKKRGVHRTIEKERMGLNILGSSFSTRFLCLSMMKKFYASKPASLLIFVCKTHFWRECK